MQKSSSKGKYSAGQAKEITGVVVKIISTRYTVECEDGTTRLAFPRGRLRLVGDVYVGDSVVVSDCKPYAGIERVLPRKTSLIRPYVANVDTVLIVIAPEPEPDLLLVDKLIVNAFKQGVKPVLVINKCDIANPEFIKRLTSVYSSVCDVACVSANSLDSLATLEKYFQGKLVAFAGQSAVGKTSIMNALLEKDLPVGELSKIKRGKNTTRHVEIYHALGGMVADTCGFSAIELDDMSEEELRFYYEEYVALQNECKVSRCEHVFERDCAVKRAVQEGKLDEDRYQRYTEIYKELKENRKRKYGQSIDSTIDSIR